MNTFTYLFIFDIIPYTNLSISISRNPSFENSFMPAVSHLPAFSNFVTGETWDYVKLSFCFHFNNSNSFILFSWQITPVSAMWSIRLNAIIIFHPILKMSRHAFYSRLNPFIMRQEPIHHHHLNIKLHYIQDNNLLY